MEEVRGSLPKDAGALRSGESPCQAVGGAITCQVL